MRGKRLLTKAEFVRALQALGITGQEQVDTRADVEALVRRSYRLRAKDAHPDNGGTAEAFQVLTTAFETATEYIVTHRFREERPALVDAAQFRGATIFVNGRAVGRVEVRYDES